MTRTDVVDPEDSAAAAGLVYVDPDEPGIARVRHGTGFGYRTETGRTLTSKRHLARIDALAIPPAWTDVWICSAPTGHIQAVGFDADGRRQYRYHDRWDAERSAEKFARLAGFGAGLTDVRRQVALDLDDVPGSRRAVTALVIGVLDATLARVGGPSTGDAPSHGLTTLERRHVRPVRGGVALWYTGKAGSERRLEIRDPALVAGIRACRALGGPTLFSYCEDDEIHPVTATDVNDRLGATGTARDFRTWGATVAVIEALAPGGSPADGRGTSEVLEAIDLAAARLGNTRAVCRHSSVHPRVESAYVDGSLHAAWRHARRTRHLSRAERTALRLLTS